MVKESDIYKKMAGCIGTVVDFQRHEDKYSRGIPDVSFGVANINGWIELKRVERWPSDPEKALSIKHFTPHQKNWLRRRQKFGGNTWLLLQVSDDYMFFRGDQCDEIGLTLTKQQLMDKAHSVLEDKTKFGMWVFHNLKGEKVLV